jgi:hypothetical protein
MNSISRAAVGYHPKQEGTPRSLLTPTSKSHQAIQLCIPMSKSRQQAMAWLLRPIWHKGRLDQFQA